MKENKSNKFDEYFTKQEISEKLFEITKKCISHYDNIDDYFWLEPSVGKGCFFGQLPQNRRIGIDINPQLDGVIKSDYLEFNLPDKPLIVIGNPPFGHRGVMALEFINHSQQADYIAFILPMFYQSLGKGSIRYRVNNFNLIYETILPKNSFYTVKNNEIHDKDVKCCFQIWSKHHHINNTEFSWYRQKGKKSEPYSDLLDVITVSLAPKRECGKEWIYQKRETYYLSSTFYKDNRVVNDFEKVKYKSGLAIVYKTQNKSITKKLDKLFTQANWLNYSSLATNGCRHIGKSHIYKLLADNNF